jgi:hypothetical protein
MQYNKYYKIYNHSGGASTDDIEKIIDRICKENNIVLNRNQDIRPATNPDSIPVTVPTLRKIYTVPDGTCLIHSFLQCTSENYRRIPQENRSIVGETFRTNFLPIILETNKNSFPDHLFNSLILEDKENPKYTYINNLIRDLTTKNNGNFLWLEDELLQVLATIYGVDILYIRENEESKIFLVSLYKGSKSYERNPQQSDVICIVNKSVNNPYYVSSTISPQTFEEKLDDFKNKSNGLHFESVTINGQFLNKFSTTLIENIVKEINKEEKTQSQGVEETKSDTSQTKRVEISESENVVHKISPPLKPPTRKVSRKSLTKEGTAIKVNYTLEQLQNQVPEKLVAPLSPTAQEVINRQKQSEIKSTKMPQNYTLEQKPKERTFSVRKPLKDQKKESNNILSKLFKERAEKYKNQKPTQEVSDVSVSHKSPRTSPTRRQAIEQRRVAHLQRQTQAQKELSEIAQKRLQTDEQRRVTHLQRQTQAQKELSEIAQKRIQKEVSDVSVSHKSPVKQRSPPRTLVPPTRSRSPVKATVPVRTRSPPKTPQILPRRLPPSEDYGIFPSEPIRSYVPQIRSNFSLRLQSV